MKMSHLVRSLFCIAIVSAGFTAAPANAVLLLDETFTYPNGSIIGQNGGTAGLGSWTTPWVDSLDANTHFQMQSQQLASIAANGSGAVQRSFSTPAAAGNTLYFAYDMNVAVNNEGGYDVFMNFLSGAVRMGIRNDAFRVDLGASNGIFTPADPAFTGTFRLVSRLQFNQVGSDEVLTFWIDPTSEGDIPIATLQQDISALDLGSLVSITKSGQEGNLIRFDNFALGTDFNFTEPVPAPEPSSLLLLGGVLGFAARRRRRQARR